MNLDDLLAQICPWLRSEGEENEIVIACRIRLARNLVGYPFPIRASEQERRAVQETVRQAADEIFTESNFYFADIPTLSPLDREFLLERHLITKELALSERTSAIIIDSQERFSIILNDDEHVQILAAASGLVAPKIWGRINSIDDQLAGKLDYVFHKKYGFLTSSVTNVGTGATITAMLHLPALVIAGEIGKVARSLQKANVTLRGLFGEPARALGDFFQMSNRITLGKSEEDLIAKITDLVPQIVSYEHQARHFLINNRREVILDRCSRAVGVLRNAQTISNVEAMVHLSNLRLGIHTGLLKGFDVHTVDMLQLHMQPAHLQKIHGSLLSQAERDVVRATFIRQRIDR